MKILHVAPSYYPATYWGGPIWSTKAICDGVAANPDMDLQVLTTDAAGPNVGDRISPVPLPYPVHYACRVAGHSIAPGLISRLPAAIMRADVVHLTGAYSAPTLPVFILCKLMGKPLVWSPRGALQATQDWGSAPRVAMKRRFERVLNFCRPRGMVMHVTAPSEAAQSTTHFAGVQTQSIPNAVTLPTNVTPTRRSHQGLRLMSMGRLHPKKGIEVLLKALAQLPADVTLDIYGAGTPAYTHDLQMAAQTLGDRVHFHGQLSDADKQAAFARADLFVLPSYSENFGIVVAEALAHATPVLTTTRTPWAMLNTMGCGRCVPLSDIRLVTEISALASADLAAMGARGRAWMQRDFAPDAMVDSFAVLYQSLAASPLQRVTA